MTSFLIFTQYEFFVETANSEQIKEAQGLGIWDGVATKRKLLISELSIN
jgi:hypothetical protein